MQDVVRVRTLYPNGSAAKVGVTVGDIITHLDDTPITGMSVAELQRSRADPSALRSSQISARRAEQSGRRYSPSRANWSGSGWRLPCRMGPEGSRSVPELGLPRRPVVMAGDIITHVDEAPIHGLNSLK